MSKYKYVLFDLDGTTANTDMVIVKSMYALYDLYRNGVYTPIETLWYFSGPPIYNNLKKEFPDMDADFIHSEFVKISTDLYPKVTTEYPHCREVLLELKKSGIKVGLVTNKSRNPTYVCLKAVNLSDVFDVMVCYDDVPVGKPDPQGILKALKELGANNLQEALYIGDNALDLESANNAGIDCMLVTWGPRVLSKELKPKYWAKDFLEVKGIILDE